MESLRTIWNDVRRTLKQTKDDLEIPDRQGWYWTLVIADRLRMQHEVKRDSGAYVTTFAVPVETAADFLDRPFVTLPKSIYDLDMDAGVESLSFYAPNGSTPEFARIELFRVTPSTLRMYLMSTTMARGHFFWREGPRLYMHGVSPSVPFMEAKLRTTLPDVTTVDPDAQFDFPKELLIPLIKEITDMGRFALGMPGVYLRNDGTNRPMSLVIGNAEKQTSVNSPVVNTAIEPVQ